MSIEDSSGRAGREDGDPGDWQDIADYVSDRATPEVRRNVEMRRRHDARFRHDLEAAELLWQRAGAALDLPISAADTDAALKRLRRELFPRSAVSLDRDGRLAGRAASSRRWHWGPLAAAASIVALLGVGVALLMQSPAAVAMQEYSTAPGERIDVRLPDGGRVVLAPGSTMHVPEHFVGDTRAVSLSGRAYFEVAHDASRPFVVRTDALVVRVLGTSFDLRAYADAATTEVVVTTGRVAVEPAGTVAAGPAVLARGDRAVIDAVGGLSVERETDTAAAISWTTGRLAFERASLADVVADLERWYDVSIVVADPELARRRLTAAFSGEPIDVVLETVAALVGARPQRDGRTVLLIPQPIR